MANRVPVMNCSVYIRAKEPRETNAVCREENASERYDLKDDRPNASPSSKVPQTDGDGDVGRNDDERDCTKDIRVCEVRRERSSGA